MATTFIEEDGLSGGPVIVRLADGSEVDLFELVKENTSNRGVHDTIEALEAIEEPEHKDIAYVVDEGAVMAFIDGEWQRPGPALTSVEDISNAIAENEYYKLIAGLSARINVLKVVN